MQVTCPQYVGVTGLNRYSSTYNEDNFLDDVNHDNCTVTWLPPLPDSVDACYPDVISECVQSDDQTLVDLCEAFDSVFALFKGDNRLFKNIYCAACNGVRITDPKSHLLFSCKNFRKQTDLLTTMTVMIRLEFLSQTFSSPRSNKADERNTTQTRACNYNEIYVTGLVSRA